MPNGTMLQQNRPWPWPKAQQPLQALAFSSRGLCLPFPQAGRRKMYFEIWYSAMWFCIFSLYILWCLAFLAALLELARSTSYVTAHSTQPSTSPHCSTGRKTIRHNTKHSRGPKGDRKTYTHLYQVGSLACAKFNI